MYLSVWGLRALRKPRSEAPVREASPLVAGFWSNLLNAKQYLFLFILLPGFLPANAHWTDTLLLLAILAVISLLFWTVWIWGISRLGSWQRSSWIEAGSLLALGVVGILLLFGII